MSGKIIGTWFLVSIGRIHEGLGCLMPIISNVYERFQVFCDVSGIGHSSQGTHGATPLKIVLVSIFIQSNLI